MTSAANGSSVDATAAGGARVANVDAMATLSVREIGEPQVR